MLSEYQIGTGAPHNFSIASSQANLLKGYVPWSVGDTPSCPLRHKHMSYKRQTLHSLVHCPLQLERHGSNGPLGSPGAWVRRRPTGRDGQTGSRGLTGPRGPLGPPGHLGLEEREKRGLRWVIMQCLYAFTRIQVTSAHVCANLLCKR